MFHVWLPILHAIHLQFIYIKVLTKVTTPGPTVSLSFICSLCNNCMPQKNCICQLPLSCSPGTHRCNGNKTRVSAMQYYFNIKPGLATFATDGPPGLGDVSAKTVKWYGLEKLAKRCIIKCLYLYMCYAWLEFKLNIFYYWIIFYGFLYQPTDHQNVFIAKFLLRKSRNIYWLLLNLSKIIIFTY